jgi:hypothetical protein
MYWSQTFKLDKENYRDFYFLYFVRSGKKYLMLINPASKAVHKVTRNKLYVYLICFLLDIW